MKPIGGRNQWGTVCLCNKKPRNCEDHKCYGDLCIKCLRLRLPEQLNNCEICYNELSEKERVDLSLKNDLLSKKTNLVDLYRSENPLSPKQVSRMAMWALDNRNFQTALKMIELPTCDLLTFHGFATKEWIFEQHRIIQTQIEWSHMSGFSLRLKTILLKIGGLFNKERHVELMKCANARVAALYVTWGLRPVLSYDVSKLLGKLVFDTRTCEEWYWEG